MHTSLYTVDFTKQNRCWSKKDRDIVQVDITAYHLEADEEGGDEEMVSPMIYRQQGNGLLGVRE